MRTCLFFLLLKAFLPAYAHAQTEISGRQREEPAKYISFGILSLGEPHMAAGPSAGIRFTERSEVFFEAAYITLSPFYDWPKVDRLNGIKTILQYRYHFLQQWKPLFNLGGRRRFLRSRHEPFIGLEFRAKPFSYSSSNEFVNPATADTLRNYAYRGRAFVYGGAVIFGNTLNISSDGKWKVECTFGVGAKARQVKYQNVPAGYQRPAYLKQVSMSIPPVDEELTTVCFPFALRLRYQIGQ